MNGPWRITFDTNPDDCNHKCIMCEQHSIYAEPRKESHNRMPFELIENVVSECSNFGLREIIPSTMGEPLLWKDFEKLIGLCHKKGIKLNLTTNSSFPVLGAEKWAELLIPVVSDIKFSWNGATKKTQESIMVGSNWEKGISGIKTFVQKREKMRGTCTFTLQTTFLELNVDELVDLVRLASDLGLDRVKGHHVWSHFPALKKISMRRDLEAIKHWNRVAEKAIRIAQDLGIRLDNVTILGEGAVKELDPDAVCPFLDREAWVDPNGVFHPCCAPDAQRRSLGDFGNVAHSGLMEIWHSAKYRDLVENYLQNELCRMCNMRRRVN